MNAPRHITINREIVDQTLRAMRNFGAHGWELLVLWLGDIEPETGNAIVTEAFIPDQKPISNEDGIGYFVSSDALFNLNKDLLDNGLQLIAQVHSHPNEAFHSHADDRYAIVTAQGGLSLVVPNFGSAPLDLAEWAIYQLSGQEWQEMSSDQVKSVFQIT